MIKYQIIYLIYTIVNKKYYTIPELYIITPQASVLFHDRIKTYEYYTYLHI